MKLNKKIRTERVNINFCCKSSIRPPTRDGVISEPSVVNPRSIVLLFDCVCPYCLLSFVCRSYLLFAVHESLLVYCRLLLGHVGTDLQQSYLLALSVERSAKCHNNVQ